jgi:hypothetical protein
VRCDTGAAFRMALEARLRSFRRLATEVGVSARTLTDGVRLAELFANPILDGSATGRWTPADGQWR